jgi:hypothetical protein
MNFQSMITALDLQTSGKLSSQGADTTNLKALLNRAQAELIEGNSWFALQAVQAIGTQPQYATGTVTMIQGSSFVQLTGGNVNLAWGQGWYLWVGGGPPSAPPIKIVSVESAFNAFEIEIVWPAVNQTTGFTIAPLLYPVVGALEIFDVRALVSLEKTSRERLDLIDPARVATGGTPPIKWAPGPRMPGPIINPPNPANLTWPSVELWPLAAGGQQLLAEIKLAAVPLVNPTDVPQLLSSVIVEKAAYFACEALYADTGDQSWLGLRDRHERNFEKEFEKATVADRLIEGSKVRIEGQNPVIGYDTYVNHDFAGPG